MTCRVSAHLGKSLRCYFVCSNRPERGLVGSSAVSFFDKLGDRLTVMLWATPLHIEELLLKFSRLTVNAAVVLIRNSTTRYPVFCDEKDLRLSFSDKLGDRCCDALGYSAAHRRASSKIQQVDCERCGADLTLYDALSRL